MKFSVLGSGSRGNATYLETAGTAILIDAGMSGIELQRRLDAIGVELSSLHAIFLTHEHNDHIQGVGVLARRCKIPVYANLATFKSGEKKNVLMTDLINMMDEKEIKALADEIYEFNIKIKEARK